MLLQISPMVHTVISVVKEATFWRAHPALSAWHRDSGQSHSQNAKVRFLGLDNVFLLLCNTLKSYPWEYRFNSINIQHWFNAQRNIMASVEVSSWQDIPSCQLKEEYVILTCSKLVYVLSLMLSALMCPVFRMPAHGFLNPLHPTFKWFWTYSVHLLVQTVGSKIGKALIYQPFFFLYFSCTVWTTEVSWERLHGLHTWCWELHV